MHINHQYNTLLRYNHFMLHDTLIDITRHLEMNIILLKVASFDWIPRVIDRTHVEGCKYAMDKRVG